MRGWIFFPEKEKLFPPTRFQLFPNMNPLEDSDGEPEEPAGVRIRKIQGASLGFYCGPVAGDPSPSYPSLLEGVSQYPQTVYKPRFQPTRKIWESLPPIMVRPSNRPPAWLWTGKTFHAPCIVVNGSFPRMMEDLFVRGCQTFRFSPYLLK